MSEIHKNIGSDFEEFLEKESILAECQAEAIKRVLAFQVEQTMKKQGLTKSAMAKKMSASRSSLDRLLSPEKSVTLNTISQAASALGGRLEMNLILPEPGESFS
ncbi:MAG: Fis family transcriptional regulator [Desulfobacteraceae bacterium 4572_88]|nr:MAG: Fis family transcriptional regulator [Desulfobacteraceae bacterium 4572_88]